MIRWCVLCVIASGVALAPVAVDDPHVGGIVQEDDPGWDCRVDGNRVCGTVQLPVESRPSFGGWRWPW